MRLKRLVLATGAVSGCIAGAAFAAHVSEVDPQTVPTGLLAAHNRIQVIPVDAVRQAVQRGAEISVQHARLEAGQASGWHTHRGPVLVSVVRGALTYEHAVSGECRRDVYEAGSGFTDRGLGKVHRAIAGPQGADFYAVYILPRGTEQHLIAGEPLRECTT